MRFLKQILFIFLAPTIAYGQTVHREEDRIVYRGSITVAGTDQEALYQRAKDAMHNVKGGNENSVEENNSKGMIIAKGKIKLVTPYYLIKTVEYVLELSAKDGNYKYRIDSVYLIQKERGGKEDRISSEKLLKAVEATGQESIDTEKVMNEIDMDFQKLLATIYAEMSKAPVAKHPAASVN
jgi:hypothetical protein